MRLIIFSRASVLEVGDIDNVYFAKLAEQAERYDEMAEHMRYVGTWKEASSVCLY